MSSNEISRRFFLGLIPATLTYLAFPPNLSVLASKKQDLNPGLLGSGHPQKTKERSVPEEEKLLKIICDKYDFMERRGYRIPFSRLMFLFKGYFRSDHKPEIQAYLDPLTWGREKPNVEKLANQHVLTKIQMTNSNYEQRGIEFLGKMAKIFGPLILCLPPKINWLNDGGFIDGYKGALEKFFKSVQSGQAAVVTFLHESLHAVEGNPDPLRQVVSLKDFLLYIALYQESIISVAAVYSHQPNLPALLKFKQGKNLFDVYERPIDALARKMDKLLRSEYSSLSNGWGKKPNNYSQNTLNGMNAALGLTFTIREHLFDKGARGEALSALEIKFLKDRYTLAVADLITEEIGHFLVGPAQTRLGLPKNRGELVKDSLMDWTATLDLLRLHVFSNLGNPTYEALQERLKTLL